MTASYAVTATIGRSPLSREIVCVEILTIQEFALIKKIQKPQILVSFDSLDNHLSSQSLSPQSIRNTSRIDRRSSMIHLYYKWRYRRSQCAGAFTLPKQNRQGKGFRGNFGSYLAQPSVRGRDFSRFDLPKQRRRWLRIAFTLVLTLTLGWLIYESAAALTIFR